MLLTAAGAAAIAVVRICGAGVRGFLEQHCARVPSAGRAVHTQLRDRGHVIDDPLVFLAGDEQSAEISLHGGPWVVREAMELMRRCGFELYHRLPLPLPQHAVDGETEFEREMLAHLPLATTELALEVLLAQQHARQHLKKRPQEERLLQAMLDDYSLWWLLHPPRVAIVGAANAGKSTLANLLFAQERSITADLPGTTRDWVGELANLEGLTVLLVDTPGLRETDDAIERMAIDRSGEQVQRADLIVLVLDASRPLQPEQSLLLERFPDALWVVNKWDLATWSPDRSDAVRTVATTGEGVARLMSRIRSYFGCEQIDASQPRWWTARQRDILQRSITEPTALQSL